MMFSKKDALLLIKEFNSCIDLTNEYFSNKQHTIREKEAFFQGAFFQALSECCDFNFIFAFEKLLNGGLNGSN